jgi:centrosomal protein CEP290
MLTCKVQDDATEGNPSYPSQIEFLEVRLSEVMASADIPPSMRPALMEYDPVGAILGNGAAGLLPTPKGGGVGGAGVRLGQVQAIKAAILKSLMMLREVRQSLGETRAYEGSESGSSFD